MFVEKICAAWIEHPFWRHSLLIGSQAEIDALAASGVKEVWIDPEKGLDVSSDCRSRATPSPVRVPFSRAEASKRVSVSAELARASEIYVRSKADVMSMFSEARLGGAVNSAGAEKTVEEISDSIDRNPHALISLARIKTADDYTYMHSIAVSALMITLAKQLGMSSDEVRRAGIAGLLHDLGKTFTPTSILNKPDKLLDEELLVLRKHPEDGYRMLCENYQNDEIVLDVVLHHHEKIEGSGYPNGLRGDEISIFTRMGAICDVYDALTSNRPYKLGWDPAESLHQMAKWSSGHFDQILLEAFVKSLGIYPIGSLVKLKRGHLAVVIEQDEHSLLTPRVKAFYSTKHQCHITPEIIELSRWNCADEIVSREDPARWNIQDLNQLWANKAD